MKKGCAYLRCSTIGQAEEGFTLENQKRAVQEYSKGHGINLVHIYEDGGKSGRTIKRPEFQDMLGNMETQHIECIVIYKIDRFARNVSDFSRILSELKAKNIELYSLQEGNLTNGSSLIPNIFASVAQWESEVNGDRTRDALMQKFRGGWQPTRPNIGYRTVGAEHEQKTCEIDPFAGPIIKKMFELYSTGQYSMVSLQEWLQDKNLISKNGTILSFSRINNILNDPFYYGLIRWHGQEKIGKHTPLISKQLFDMCKYVLEKHRNFLLREGRKYDFLLRGFVYCTCGMRLIGDACTVRSNNKKIHYYHCQKRYSPDCRQKYAHSKDVEDQVAERLKELEFDQDFIDQIRHRAETFKTEGKKDSQSVKQGLTNQKTALEIRRSKLVDLMIDGTIDQDTYKKKQSELGTQIANIEIQADEITDENKIDNGLIDTTLYLTKDIYATYLRAATPLKRHFIRFFYERFVIEDKKIIEAKPTPIFNALLCANMVRLRQTELPRVDSNHGHPR